MGSRDFYKPGDWNVICDRCGMKRKASECKEEWTGLFVCSDTCWEPQHPQDFVTGTAEDVSVPVARPDVAQTMGQTTVKTTVAAGATTIDLTATTDVEDDDSIGIVLDNSATHWTFSDGDPVGDTVTLGSPLPWAATALNVVYLPAVNSLTAAEHITGEDL